MLEKAFLRIRQFNLKLNPKKCVFGSSDCEYLGYRITPQGTRPTDHKVEDIQNLKPPTSKKEVSAFLGMLNYFRMHIQNFSQRAFPLTQLLTKDGFPKDKKLPDAAIQAFNDLKNALTTAPVLAFPRRNDPFILTTDASENAYGAVLTQIIDGKERVISYASRTLKQAEKNYSAYVGEINAICWAIDHSIK